MTPIRIRFGGYQPPASVYNRAAEVLGQALGTRLGDAVQFELDGNIIASGYQAAALLGMIEGGAMTMGYFSASYLAARLADAERALFIDALSPVRDQQRHIFGNQLCSYLES
jgi:hypothetical protein